MRTWENPNTGSTVYFIEGEMEADSGPAEWSVGTLEQYVAETKGRLDGLIGTKHEFRVEEKDQFRNRDQFKLLDYPGKPGGGSGGGYRGGGGGGGGKGGGNWETAPERMFKNLSIEAQGSLGRLATVAIACIDDGRFNLEVFNAAVNAIVTNLETVAGAVRETAQQTPGGSPSDAQAPAPVPVTPAAAPTAPTNGSTPATTTPDDRTDLTNALLAHFGRPSRIKAEWEDAEFGDEAPELEDMSIAELEELVKRVTEGAL